jgi:Flp pilus assembly protein TadB
LTYGKKNQTVEVVRSFWVVPVIYMIGAAVALIVLIGLIILAVVLINRRRSRRTHRGRSGLSVGGRSRR